MTTQRETMAVPPVLSRTLPGRERLLEELTLHSLHAAPSYLFVGPPGCGKWEGALAFAAAILCPRGGCSDCAICISVTGGAHPDVSTYRRRGTQLEVAEAREIVKGAMTRPQFSSFRIVVVPEIHLARLSAPTLLKTLEEPPLTTIFVLTAEGVDQDMAALASRCVRVEFPRPTVKMVKDYLLAKGMSEAVDQVALISRGRLDRALALSAQPQLLSYYRLWQSIPNRLRREPKSLSELAFELEPEGSKKAPASAELAGEEEGGSSRRTKNEMLLLGLEAFLSSQVSEATSPTSLPRLPMPEVLRAVNIAKISLARNISIPLILREFLFALAETA